MTVKQEGDTLYVDIHGLRAEQAKQRLESLINNARPEIRQLVVIHGYHGGQALQGLVRKELSSPRIKQVRPGFQDGQSIVFLR